MNAWTAPDFGALFVVTGPSGSGKTTLLHEAFARVPGLAFSVSATTRAARTGERNGVDYNFVSDERFDALVERRQLLEWAPVYDRRYGTPRAPVEQALADGKSIVLDIDVQGARQVRAAFPECVSIFILPRSIEVLRERLEARGTDSDDIIASRMTQVMGQLSGCGEFDYLVVNDDLHTAHLCFQGVLLAELQRAERHGSLVQRFTPASGVLR